MFRTSGPPSARELRSSPEFADHAADDSYDESAPPELDDDSRATLDGLIMQARSMDLPPSGGAG